jgi:protein phosphatase
VVGFVVLLAVLVGGAGVAVAWYARGSYFVGLDGANLTIYKGRPGGLLWFQPTIVRRTSITLSEVPAAALSDLQSGQEEATVGDAQAYIDNLHNEQQQSQSTSTTTSLPTSSTTSPAGVTTTVASP